MVFKWPTVLCPSMLWFLSISSNAMVILHSYGVYVKY
jgi:hypothetical protein